MNVNVLIVTTDASYISSQYGSWETAIQETARKMSDSWYNARLTTASPAFMRETSDPSGALEQHTMGSIVRNARAAAPAEAR